MRAELPKAGSLVLLHHVHVVQERQPLERVHHDQDVPGVRLYVRLYTVVSCNGTETLTNSFLTGRKTEPTYVGSDPHPGWQN